MKKINIKGPIIPSNHQFIYNWLGMEATSPKAVNEQLEDAKMKRLRLRLTVVEVLFLMQLRFILRCAHIAEM